MTVGDGGDGERIEFSKLIATVVAISLPGAVPHFSSSVTLKMISL